MPESLNLIAVADQCLNCSGGYAPSHAHSYLISTASVTPDYLDEIALSHFELLLRAFHVPIRAQSCKAEYLEELFYTALKHRYPDTTLIWDAGSHAKGTDITIIENNIVKGRTIAISAKTGSEETNGISVSGFRLQDALGVADWLSLDDAWCKGGQNLIDWLNTHPSEVVMLLAPSTITADEIVYEIRHISTSIFKYPDASDWWRIDGKGQGNEGQGKSFRTYLPGGVTAEIRTSMSWQIWWVIPKQSTTLVKRIRLKR